jgi:hypothetical protein
LDAPARKRISDRARTRPSEALYAFIVLTLEGDRISAMTWFGDVMSSPISGFHEFSPRRRPVTMACRNDMPKRSRGFRLEGRRLGTQRRDSSAHVY